MKFLKNIVAMVALLAIGSMDAKSVGGAGTAYQGGALSKPQVTKKVTQQPLGKPGQGKSTQATGNVNEQYDRILKKLETNINNIVGEIALTRDQRVFSEEQRIYQEIITLLNNSKLPAEDRLEKANKAYNAVGKTIVNALMAPEFSEAITTKIDALDKQREKAKAQFENNVNTIKSSLEAKLGQSEEGQGGLSKGKQAQYEAKIIQTLETMNKTQLLTTAFKKYTLKQAVARLENLILSLNSDDNALEFLINKLIAKGGPAEGIDKDDLQAEIYEIAYPKEAKKF